MGLIRVTNFPISVDLEHDDSVIETVDDGFGGTIDVFRIQGIKYTNHTTQPYQFYAEDEEGTNDELTIGANADGERNIPTPKRFKSYPIARIGLTLIR